MDKLPFNDGPLHSLRFQFIRQSDGSITLTRCRDYKTGGVLRSTGWDRYHQLTEPEAVSLALTMMAQEGISSDQGED